MKSIELSFSHIDKNNIRYFNYKCDCGNLFKAQRSNMRVGGTKGCGCLRGKDSIHGHYKGDKPSRTYLTWQSMIRRCEDPRFINYDNYGGRGIRICQSWHWFPYFLEDMGERPQGKTLDRIDNNGNYVPCNCKWSTPKEQANNRRKPSRRTLGIDK